MNLLHLLASLALFIQLGTSLPHLNQTTNSSEPRDVTPDIRITLWENPMCQGPFKTWTFSLDSSFDFREAHGKSSHSFRASRTLQPFEQLDLSAAYGLLPNGDIKRCAAYRRSYFARDEPITQCQNVPETTCFRFWANRGLVKIVDTGA